MVEQQTPAAQPSAARPFQFSLRQLLAAFFVICTLLGAYSSLGWDGVTLWAIAACIIAIPVGLYRKNHYLAFGPIFTLVFVACLLPTLDGGSRGPHRRVHCNNNLKQIGIALHRYHDRYGSFPPAYVADENGKPMHSWRVLILPYMEHNDLYDRYDFSEPWDGPNNKSLATKMPIFECPSDPARQLGNNTSYFAVVGPGTAWPSVKPAKLQDLSAGLSKTILVVEVAGANIGWMEPRDLNLARLDPAINSKQAKGISSKHTKGANVLFADGHVEFLPSHTLPEQVRALLAPPNDEK